MTVTVTSNRKCIEVHRTAYYDLARVHRFCRSVHHLERAPGIKESVYHLLHYIVCGRRSAFVLFVTKRLVWRHVCYSPTRCDKVLFKVCCQVCVLSSFARTS